VFIVSVDGLSGFPDAIKTVFPETKIQLCVVHQIRNSLKYVSYKDRKTVAKDLKNNYRSVTEEEARMELDRFADKWDSQYSSITKSWRTNWENLIALFDYPDEIRRIIYTTNAIESLNSVIRKSIKNRNFFRMTILCIRLSIWQLSRHPGNGLCLFGIGSQQLIGSPSNMMGDITCENELYTEKFTGSDNHSLYL